MSCPWYTSTQFDCCQQAKHNQLLVVYVAKDSQFYAPVNHHVKKKEGDVFEYEVCENQKARRCDCNLFVRLINALLDCFNVV